MRQRILILIMYMVAIVGRPAPTAAGPPRSRGSLNRFLKGARSPYVQTRVNALRKLAKFAGSRASVALLLALKDARPRVRAAATKALGTRKNPSAIPALLSVLPDRNSDVRKGATAALAKIGKPAVRSLLIAVHRTHPDVRAGVRRALIRIGKPSVNGLTALLKDNDWHLRKLAAGALGAIGDRAAVAALTAAAVDQDADVREAVARSLGRLEDARAVPVLLKLLKDKDGDVRCQTAHALGDLKDGRSLTPLTAATKDRDALVRKAAARAIARIKRYRLVVRPQKCNQKCEMKCEKAISLPLPGPVCYPRNTKVHNIPTGGFSMKSLSFCLAVLMLVAPGCSDDDGSTNDNIDGAPPGCGNGVMEAGEECDNGANNSDTERGACRTDCRLAHCGDSVADPNESCDGADMANTICADRGYTGGILACAADCSFDESGCSDCGNGTAEAEEECDGSDMANQTCATVTGLQEGILTCRANCIIDASDCHTCGNTIQDGPEECDTNDFGGETCESQGRPSGGTLTCSGTCTIQLDNCFVCPNGSREGNEECDTNDVNGAVCTDFGYPSGTVQCANDCTFDLNNCCGDGVMGSLESCDGSDFGTQTCGTLGYGAGFLACNASCVLDTSACCGDDNIGGSEACDGVDLASQSCNTQGYPQGGTLSCLSDCTGYDFVNCCGDGNAGTIEACDGSDLKGETCASQGFPGGGTLTCSANCTLNTSACYVCGNGTVEGIEECDDANTTDWDGCTDCMISQFLINTYTTAHQAAGGVALNDDGTFVVVWQSELQDNDFYGIYARVYDDTGNPVTAEIPVNTQTAGDQGNPSVSADSAGNFVVVWESDAQDGDGYGIYGQRFTAAGATVGFEFEINDTTVGEQRFPQVGSGAAGQFVVMWQDNGEDGSGQGIFGQRYLANGNPAAVEFQVNTTTTGDQQRPDIGVAPDGRFVVVWQGPDSSGTGVYGRTFDNTGTATSGEISVNTATAQNQEQPRVAIEPDGRFVVAFASYPTGDQQIIFHRFDPFGTAVGTEVLVAASSSDALGAPDIAVIDSGNCVVTWNHVTASASWWQGPIMARRYNAANAPLGVAFQVSDMDTWGQIWPFISMASDGRFLIVWSGGTFNNAGAGDLDVYGQRFDAAGNPRGVLTW